MRLRIIAYGIAVLLVLAGVSLAAFWATSPPGPHPATAHAALAHELATADDDTRARLLDDATASRLEVSIYDADARLLASNVQPPIPRGPELRPPPDEPARVHEPLRTPALPVLEAPARTPPERLTFDGIEVLLRAGAPPSPFVPFALALAITMLALVLLSFPVTAAMTRRLEALALHAHRLGEGDLSQRADASGSDEVSRTARAFNAMAERIAELRLRERELFANVSHELRTPMARMAVLLELTEDDPREARRYVGELARDLRELESLLDSIIETFRLDLASARAREPWPMRRTALDLRALLRELADDFHARAPGTALSLELPAAAVVRDVDRVLVRRALMNLLDNARKYAPGGSAIGVRLDDRGEIAVVDRGPGIEPADLPHVFEPFFRADRSRVRSTGGVGLGLTFVRLAARLHGGDVSVESTPGRGTTFRVGFGDRTRSDTLAQPSDTRRTHA